MIKIGSNIAIAFILGASMILSAQSDTNSANQDAKGASTSTKKAIHKGAKETKKAAGKTVEKIKPSPLPTPR